MASVDFAVLPAVDEPIDILLERCRRQSSRMHKRKKAENWYPITLPETKPFGLMFFGDPHLDDDGCHWDLLLQHVEIAKSTPGLYAASLGDATNNWTGRLLRLYAKQEKSLSTARRLIRWFMRDAGIPWLVWNIGNHDAWESGDAILGLIADGAHYMPGWRAKFELRASGQRYRVDQRHDFPGSSIYNKTHGPARAAMFAGAAADLYVCGHRHTFGYQSFECGESRPRVAHALRLGSYKWHDEHAEQLGFTQSEIPAALAIFDPTATTPAGRVMVFPDVIQGAKVLTALRRSSR
jgi:hypothetical protein